jgi:hypothetical protein
VVNEGGLPVARKLFEQVDKPTASKIVLRICNYFELLNITTKV